jgi:hypothetical protein
MGNDIPCFQNLASLKFYKYYKNQVIDPYFEI